MTTSSSWRLNIIEQLRFRDGREKIPFESIINSNLTLYSKLQSALKERESKSYLENFFFFFIIILIFFKKGNALTISSGLMSTGNNSSAISNSQAVNNTKELEKKIEKLQEELTATYKKEAKEATSQLVLEAELRLTKTHELELKESLERLKMKLRETSSLLEEESRSAGRAREEATTLRDELMRVRRLLERAENRIRDLSKENSSLVINKTNYNNNCYVLI